MLTVIKNMRKIGCREEDISARAKLTPQEAQEIAATLLNITRLPPIYRRSNFLGGSS